MPCNICALVSAEIGSNACPLHRALERTNMAFQLAKTASALERAMDAISEAGRQLDDCRMVVRLARPESNEPLPEEEQLLNVIDALQRIGHLISERRDVVTGQLKDVQMNFLIEMEQGRATQDSNSDSDRGTVPPLRDLSVEAESLEPDLTLTRKLRTGLRGKTKHANTMRKKN